MSPVNRHLNSIQAMMLLTVQNWVRENGLAELRMCIKADAVKNHQLLYNAKVTAGDKDNPFVTLDLHPAKVVGEWAILHRERRFKTAIRFKGIVHQLSIPFNSIMGFYLPLGKKRQLQFVPLPEQAENPKDDKGSSDAYNWLSPMPMDRVKSHQHPKAKPEEKVVVKNNLKFRSRDAQQQSAYKKATDEGFSGDFEAWLTTIKSGEGLLDEDLKQLPKHGEVINLSDYRKPKGKPKK